MWLTLKNTNLCISVYIRTTTGGVAVACP